MPTKRYWSIPGVTPLFLIELFFRTQKMEKLFKSITIFPQFCGGVSPEDTKPNF